MLQQLKELLRGKVILTFNNSANGWNYNHVSTIFT